MPTETVYGLAGLATSDAAVAAIYAAKGRPTFNPLIAHFADAASARREAIFDANAARLAEAFWPGPLTIVAPVSPDCQHQPAGARGPRHGGFARARASGRASADRGGRRAAGRALRQSLGPCQPDTAPNMSPRISSRTHRLDPRRGRDAARPRIDDRRLSSTAPSACCGPARFLARRWTAALGEGVLESPAPRRASPARCWRRACCPRITRPRARLRLGALGTRQDEAALDFAGASGRERCERRGSTCRHRAIWPKPPPTCSPSCALWMRRAWGTIAAAPIPDEGLGVAINDRLRRAAAPRPGEGATNSHGPPTPALFERSPSSSSNGAP